MAEEQPAESFGQVLERLMQSRGLNQAQLARELGTWDGNVRRWRTGSGIEIENVRKIADFFGVERKTLEQLAGYGESELASADDSSPHVDPQIAALMDADRAEVHEELRDIPKVFWPTILQAGRTARKAAAEIARQAQRHAISLSGPEPISSPADPTRRTDGGDDRPSSQPLARGFSLSGAH